MIPEIDITLVSARRPQLLRLTLESFNGNLFSRLSVRRLFVNIDPIWGNEEEDLEVERICRAIFSDVVVRRPEDPGFGSAVKWLWSQVETPWHFHLEDDWLLQWRINTERLEREMAIPQVAEISLYNHGKAWRKGVYPKRFTTSPAFLRHDFAQLASKLMKLELDPEKQFYSDRNPELTAAIQTYRHRFHGSRFAPICIRDIGRVWRATCGLEKTIVDGASVWTQANKGLPPEMIGRPLRKYLRRAKWARFLPLV